MKKFFILFLIVLFGLYYCSSDSVDNEKAVAQIGNERIDLTELKTSIQLEPKYAIRTPVKKVRESQLEFLIEEMYYYLAAREAGFQDDPRIQRKIKYIEDQETIKTYLGKTIFQDISIPEGKQLQAFSRLEKRVGVQTLSVFERDEAEKLLKKLEAGFTFEQLAKTIYDNPDLRTSGGHLGYITFGDLAESLEDQVFHLKAGEVSGIIETNDGFHILKVDDIKQNEAVQNLSTAQKGEIIHRILMNRLADRKIRQRLNDLADGKKIQVNNRLIDALVGQTRYIPAYRSNEASLFKPPIPSGDIRTIALKLSDLQNEVLVRFGERELKVGEFLDRLKEMPPLHRPFLGTRTRMIQAVIDMIRDDLLLQDARKKEYHKDREQRENARFYIKNLLADEFRKKYRDRDFKEKNPEIWHEYQETLISVKASQKLKIYQENLFADIADPDSTMLPPPIPLVTKSLYNW